MKYPAIAAFLITFALAGCGTSDPGPTAAPSPSPSTASQARTTSVTNPGAGDGSPTLLRALLPQSTYSRLSLPAGVVAMPDRDRESLYIPLRQFSSPVVGPSQCLGWTAGLWSKVVTEFNQPGIELGVTEIEPAGKPQYSEAVITGPARALDSIASGQLPRACRGELTGNAAYPGTIRSLSTPRVGLGSRAFEITGARAFRVWSWVAVVRGPSFVVEIRVPDQSLDATASAELPVLTAAAYRRALAVLDPAPPPTPSPVRQDNS
jgi:hypothetical protein